MKLYIVLHHEIMGGVGQERADEMLFYVLSSMNKALESIKKVGVDEWSWWEIQETNLDGNSDWPTHVAFYNCNGRKIARPPYDECVKIYRKKGILNNVNV